MQRDAPLPFEACGFGLCSVHINDIRRNAIKLRDIVYVKRKGVGCVEQVFAEFLAFGGILLTERLEASLGFGGKLSTGQTEVTDFSLNDALTSFT